MSTSKDIQNTKVALVLQPGVFFKSDLISIRVGEKSRDGKQFNDVLIYDNSNMIKKSLGSWSYKKDPRDFKRVIIAKKGRLINPENKGKLELELIDGYMVQELSSESFKDSKVPFTKYHFKKTILNFELNKFEFQWSSENSYKRDQYLLSLSQIFKLNDSINKNQIKQYKKIESLIINEIPLLKDSIQFLDSLSKDYFSLIINNQSKAGLKRDHQSAIKKIDQLRNHLKIAKAKNKSTKNFFSNLKIEWNRKFTLSYAVFMLFFLGAPLGSIVKRWLRLACNNSYFNFSCILYSN